MEKLQSPSQGVQSTVSQTASRSPAIDSKDCPQTGNVRGLSTLANLLKNPKWPPVLSSNRKRAGATWPKIGPITGRGQSPKLNAGPPVDRSKCCPQTGNVRGLHRPQNAHFRGQVSRAESLGATGATLAIFALSRPSPKKGLEQLVPPTPRCELTNSGPRELCPSIGKIG